MKSLILFSITYPAHTISRVIFILMLMVFLSANIHAQSESAYEIQMFRPAVAGQKLHFTLEADSKRTQQVFRRQASNPPEETVRQIKMSGVLEVLAVNSFGDMTEANYEIESFSAINDEKVIAGLDAGDTLMVRIEGDSTRYYKNNTAVSDELSELLGYIIKLRTSDMPRDLDYYIIDGPQQPGSQWPIDSQLAAKGLSQNKIQVKPENVTGESHFVELLEFEGESSYRITGKVHVASLELKMPRFTKLENATIHIDFEGIYPVNQQLPVLDSKSTFSLSAKAGGSGLLRSIRMELQETRDIRRIFKPLDTGYISQNYPYEDPSQAEKDNNVEKEHGDDAWQVISVQ